MDQLKSGRRRLQRGHAVIEVALMAPWIFFLFAGALDIGFYTNALIATENAARVAAEYTSKSTNTSTASDAACRYALDEMSSLANVQKLSSCSGTPLTVTATQVTGPDGKLASQVTVTYQTDFLIPIPGLTAQLTMTRTVKMRLQTT
jgi:Flp pilus assembly protein TadG